jgi:hypothetical protein
MTFTKTAAIAAGAVVLVTVGGVGGAAAGGLIHSDQIAHSAIHTDNIRAGAVTLSKIDAAARSHLTGKTGPKGSRGATSAPGANGTNGSNGADGADGLDPALAVDNAPQEGSNAAPPSSGAGDHGFYFTGASGGSASFSAGQLLLTGSGIDGATLQGAVGIAKAFPSTALTAVDALSYEWHLIVANGDQAPSIHMTVTGATTDSHFASGFSNLVFTPGLNAPVPAIGTDVTSEALHGLWWSTAEPGGNTPSNAGSQDDPQPMSFFTNRNPNAVIAQISLDNGGTSGGSGAFSAGVDGFVLGVSGNTFERYDFGS